MPDLETIKLECAKSSLHLNRMQLTSLIIGQEMDLPTMVDQLNHGEE